MGSYPETSTDPENVRGGGGGGGLDRGFLERRGKCLCTNLVRTGAH